MSEPQVSVTPPAALQVPNAAQGPVSTSFGNITEMENASLSEKTREPVKWLKVLPVVFILAALVLTLVYYLVLGPIWQSGKYYKTTKEDFSNLQASFKKSSSEAVGLASPVKISKDSSIDLGGGRTYKDAKAGAEKTAKDINDFADLVKKADKNRSGLRHDRQINELNNNLKNYYKLQLRGMEQTSKLQAVQTKILEAIGDEFSAEFDKLFEVWNKDATRSDLAAYFDKLASLSSSVDDRLRSLKDIPDDYRYFLDAARENQGDLTATFKNVHELFLKGDDKSDAAAQDALSSLSGRYEGRRKQTDAKFAELSQDGLIKSAFDEAISLEGKINADFDKYRGKYESK
ncbi:MAG: hypothetical protein AAB512_05180 [Patescibacteria group bacterium]